MNERLNHIISKCKWDTSFDRKEKAVELQERLSAWSLFVMPQEASAVFNKVCPVGQTWRIQSLEIDLGPIDFYNLEFELSAKLHRQLNESLMDLIFYANRSGRNIEILNENTSHIQMVRSFLLNGVMPWGYKPVDGTLNQMLHYQLQNNRQEVILMLREVGVTHLNVRKRMAWQINEINIGKIIEGLEPNYHTQIIDFSNEFTKIQTEETIVQTSTADFKKNLWLWIFNFLFTDRGTVFNKIAFMKSSIVQMADHYAIAYDELFKLIERAIEEVSRRTSIKADFLLTLKALSKENRGQKKSSPGKNRNETDYWIILERYLKFPPALRSASDKKEFNELMSSLYRENKTKFAALLLSIGYTQGLWLKLIAGLNERSLEVIVAALGSTKSAMLIEKIHFLHQLSRGAKINIERKVLWDISIKFLYGKQSQSYDNILFATYFVAELSKRTNVAKEHILSQLTGANVPLAAKSIPALEIYTGLTAVFVTEASRKDSTFFTDQFRGLIDAIWGQLASTRTDKELFLSLQKLLLRNIRLSPRIALNALISYPFKDRLQQLMPYFMNEQIILLLLKDADDRRIPVIFSLQRITGKNKSEKINGSVFLSEQAIAEVGLSAIILYPKLTQEKLLEFILKQLSIGLTPAGFDEFNLFIEGVINDPDLRFYGISTFVSNTLRERFTATGGLSPLERINQLIAVSPNKKLEVAWTLINNPSDRQLAGLREQNSVTGTTVLNYLLKDGIKLKEGLIREYKTLLAPELKRKGITEIESLLNEIFWKCILSYADYKGSGSVFKALFKKTVLFRFPTADTSAHPANAAGPRVVFRNQTFALKNAGKISGDELLSLIEECLKTRSAAISRNGTRFYLTELLQIALDIYQPQLRAIIVKIPVSGMLIKVLKAAVTFDRFTLGMVQGSNLTISEGLESISLLYDLVARVTNAEIDDGLAGAYWEAALALIQTGRWTGEGISELIKRSFHHIAQDQQVNAEWIMAEIKSHNISITPALKNVLVKYLPGFSALITTQPETVISQKLLQAERTNLLYELTSWLIDQKQIPVWFGAPAGYGAADLLNEIVVQHPAKLLAVLKYEVIAEAQMDWISRTVDFKQLTRSIGVLNKTKESLLHVYAEFYKALGTITISGIVAKELQGLLFRKIIKAWTSDNWRIISTDTIWNELIWDVCVKRGISQQHFILGIEKVKLAFPLSLQASFNYLTGQVRATGAIVEKGINRKLPERIAARKDDKAALKDGISVMNAGLVLISNYIPVLFERLEITSDGKFVNELSQHDAVHYLQYIVTGLNNMEESLLPLNKILCGLPLSYPVREEIAISASQKELIDGLIEAVIGHWPSIGDSSIDGFRGNWLVREGLLIEHEDKWELIVEKRAYDLLINKSPFSFSITRFQWMNKPLYVTWPY